MAYDTTDPTLPPRMVMPVPMQQPIVPPAITTTPLMTGGPQMAAPIAPAATVNHALDTPVSAAQQEVNRLRTTGSGISQIQSPVLRGLARALDITGAVAGSVFAPLRVAEALTPGTQEHHNYLVHQADTRLGIAQQQELANTQQQDEAAQVQQRQGLATQEQAKAEALLNPSLKPKPGHLIIAGDGSAAGYQDEDGTIKPLDDPSVPQGARAVALNMAKTAPKTPLSETPLDAQEVASRNALWDPLAKKHGLPTGQFTVGMSRAEAAAIAGNLGTVVSRQQGDNHISISLQGLQNQENKNATPSANDPAQKAAVESVANGSVKLQDVFGRGATSAQKAAFVAQVKALNPQYNSGDHDIENASRKYMITGAGGVSLTANNTALHHLDLYDKAADAMNNGRFTDLNAIGNELGLHMGSDAKTNLALIRTGVALEAAKAYKGGPPDASEVKDFEKNLSGDGSPQQMHGGAATVRGMLRGKNEALKAQADAGSRGQANFGSGGSVPVEEYVRVNGKLVRK